MSFSLATLQSTDDLDAADFAVAEPERGFEARHLPAIADRLEVGVWVFDIDQSQVLWANSAALSIWDATSCEELCGRELGKDMSPAVKRRLEQHQSDFISRKAVFQEIWTLYPNGKPTPIRVRMSGYPLEGGNRMGMLCEAHRESENQHEALRSTNALLHTQLMISLHDQDGHTLYLNPASRRAFDTNSDQLKDRFARKSDYSKLRISLEASGEVCLIARMQTAEGKRWHEITARNCFDPVSGCPSILVSESDVSELKAAEARAKGQAYNDALTGLPNRLGLPQMFTDMKSRAEKHGQIIGLFFIDLDQFKSINDTLGHTYGDTMLIRIAGRLKKILNAEDAVVRLGGDEFLILSPATDPAAFTAKAELLVKELAIPVRSEGRKLAVTPSIGIARWPEHSSELQKLMQFADLAMYSAKEEGRNRFCTFEPQFYAQFESELENLTSLREGLSKDQFTVHFQPRINARTEKIETLEALVRWQHPRRGLVLPSEFIPLCEKSGLIVELGAKVLRQALKFLQQMKKAGHQSRISVNVSQRQLQEPDFHAFVRAELEKHGCCGSELELELTETLVVDSGEIIRNNLTEVRALGVTIAIDDFGTGYSNFARLSEMAVDYIKIDRSLVMGLPANAGLIQAIIAMCKVMKAAIVAEGIETREIADQMIELGAEELQGYYFGRPVAPEEILTRLEKDGNGRRPCCM
ncbi:EAL domain-containing protein [Roseibium suaedae]|uniref:EAL domain-containing protein n=1 Tax=Roseibium suaedae TaxID=735517 RepID=UPI001588211C|nr:EAL domain-containing protein [Roseibium suaedae]